MVESVPSQAPITAEEFVTGVIAALASRGLQAVKYDSLQTALRGVLPQWRTQLASHGLQLGFDLPATRNYGDNRDFRLGLKALEEKGLIMNGRSSILFQIKPSSSAPHLRTLKGTPEMWDDLGALLVDRLAR